MENESGVWRTVNGRRVFIRDGESATDAIKRSLSETDTGAKKISAKEMTQRLKAAKQEVLPEKAWRVDDTYTAEDYEHYNCECIAVGQGSCVAVKHGGEDDGDIISVCASSKDKGAVNGKQLMKIAVSHGGTKLDSFEGNHGFYLKCGFEPVSWCRFDREYAPHDWKPGRDKEEPVIFYKYTGRVTAESAKNFMMRVPVSEDYDTAKAARNASMKKG